MVAVCRPVPGAYLAWRTIRQFVLGTLIIPFTFTLFGSRCSAIARCMKSSTAARHCRGSDGPSGARLLQPAGAVSAFTFSASVATITGLLFYVTSRTPGRWCWGISPRSLKISTGRPRLAARLLVGGDWPADARMLMTNGISALQNTTVIMGLPSAL